MIVWALHGFLGLPSDFDLLQKKMQSLDPKLISAWHSVDYLHRRELSPQVALQSWGVHFAKYLQDRDPEARGDSILIGYSQGGRLAMHALQAAPQLFKAVVLISANPGIPENEKSDRLKSDQEWADRFEQQNFQKTVEKWNSQAVFQDSRQEPVRREASYNRRQLADCLKNWSLSAQQDLRGLLKATQTPVLYISGSLDVKYCKIGQSLSQSSLKMRHQAIAQAAHRVMFDQPDELARVIVEFLRPISEKTG